MSQTLDAILDTPGPGHPPCGGYPEVAQATRWTVAVTHPAKEVWASNTLNRAGYETYLPMFATLRGPRRELALVPLFPGYIFLALAPRQGWIAACHCPGIHKICMSGDRPNVVRDGAVEALQDTEDARRCLPPPDATWPPGTPCRLAGGSLAGIDAVVHRVTGDIARVHVLMFGELREVTVEVSCLAMRKDA